MTVKHSLFIKFWVKTKREGTFASCLNVLCTIKFNLYIFLFFALLLFSVLFIFFSFNWWHFLRICVLRISIKFKKHELSNFKSKGIVYINFSPSQWLKIVRNNHIKKILNKIYFWNKQICLFIIILTGNEQCQLSYHKLGVCTPLGQCSTLNSFQPKVFCHNYALPTVCCPHKSCK